MNENRKDPFAQASPFDRPSPQDRYQTGERSYDTNKKEKEKKQRML